MLAGYIVLVFYIMAIGLFLFDTLTTTLAQNSDSSSTSSQTQSELNSTLIGIISLAEERALVGLARISLQFLSINMS